jgi:hypothetical protein
MKTAMLGMVVLAGCTTIDDGVRVDVVSATIAVNPAAPDSLATVDLSVQMVADTDGEHELALNSAALDDVPGAIYQTGLDVSAFEPFWISPNEIRAVTLTNVGTTNEELAPLCGLTLRVFVYVDYLDESSGTRISGTTAAGPVTIACPVSDGRLIDRLTPGA